MFIGPLMVYIYIKKSILITYPKLTGSFPWFIYKHLAA